MQRSGEEGRMRTIRQVLCFMKKKSSREDGYKSTHFCDNLCWILSIPVLIKKTSNISKPKAKVEKFIFNRCQFRLHSYNTNVRKEGSRLSKGKPEVTCQLCHLTRNYARDTDSEKFLFKQVLMVITPKDISDAA